jgi:large subunit ribosomal protein L9
MANKLLLTQDVESLGRMGDVVNVRPGYARNFLLPRGFAVIADKSALRMQARLQEERKKKAAEERKESEEAAAKLEGVSVSIIVKVDHEGHMYGSVSAADLVHLLQEQNGIVLERRSIQLKHAIKETGSHTVHVKLKEGVTSTFKVNIVSEEVNGAIPPAESAEG